MRDWKKAKVNVVVDRATLSFLANASKLSNIEVISCIKEGCEGIVKRLHEKNLCNSRKRSVFPNTNIPVTFSTTRYVDSAAQNRDFSEWQRLHKENTGYSSWNTPNNLSTKHLQEVRDWQKNNPMPDENDSKYFYIKCRVTIPANILVFDVDQIDHMVIDYVFFGAADEYGDESVGETNS